MSGSVIMGESLPQHIYAAPISAFEQCIGVGRQHALTLFSRIQTVPCLHKSYAFPTWQAGFGPNDTGYLKPRMQDWGLQACP